MEEISQQVMEELTKTLQATKDQLVEARKQNESNIRMVQELRVQERELLNEQRNDRDQIKDLTEINERYARIIDKWLDE